jgi:putative DNA primase/helicase
MVAAKVKGDDGEQDRRILARAKSNIGPDGGGFEYSIDQVEPLPGIHASRIAWGQALEGTAKELLSDPEEEAEDGDEGKTAISQAVDFLKQTLADGLTPSTEVQKEARNNGISARTLRRASEQLNILRKKGVGGIWYCSLHLHIYYGAHCELLGLWRIYCRFL